MDGSQRFGRENLVDIAFSCSRPEVCQISRITQPSEIRSHEAFRKEATAKWCLTFFWTCRMPIPASTSMRKGGRKPTPSCGRNSSEQEIATSE